jgi:hypothetical protein
LADALLAFLKAQGLLAAEPAPDLRTILRALLSWLSRSKAPMVLVNLEDLWLETRPQNIPGTGPELPNWRRRSRYSLEEFTNMPQVVEVLREINQLRINSVVPEENMAATKTVSFRIEAPQASKVSVTGNFNGWDHDSRQLRRRKDGVWWTNLRLSPGTYEYKFVIDDQHWQEDPANPQRVLNEHGTFNSVREVS